MSCSLNGENTFFSTTTLIIQWECTHAAVYALILVVYFVINLGQQYVWAKQLQLKRLAQHQEPEDRHILPIVLWQILGTTMSSITILLLVGRNFGVIVTGIAGHAVGVAWVYGTQKGDGEIHGDRSHRTMHLVT